MFGDFSDAQRQLTLQSVVAFAKLQSPSNSPTLSLPVSMKRIRWKTAKKKRRHRFFLCSRAAYSVVCGLIWPNFAHPTSYNKFHLDVSSSQIACTIPLCIRVTRSKKSCSLSIPLESSFQYTQVVGGVYINIRYKSIVTTLSESYYSNS